MFNDVILSFKCIVYFSHFVVANGWTSLLSWCKKKREREKNAFRLVTVFVYIAILRIFFLLYMYVHCIVYTK